MLIFPKYLDFTFSKQTQNLQTLSTKKTRFEIGRMPGYKTHAQIKIVKPLSPHKVLDSFG